jgi:uncharacterized membrane protein YgdD (TMEM256/DUF423 family)
VNKRLAWPLFNLALAVALGAFGAHALEASLSEYAMGVYKTSRDYHMWLGLAWLCFSLAPLSDRGWRVARVVFPMGLIFFCGSLYGLALSGIRVLGAITPLGGATWIVGLVWLGVLALRGELVVDRSPSEIV